MSAEITRCTNCDDAIQAGGTHIEMCAVESCDCGCGGRQRVGEVSFCTMECLVDWANDVPVACGTCDGCLAARAKDTVLS